MTCYRSKERLYHNYVQNQCHILGSCLQYKRLLFKRGVGQLFLPRVSLSSRGGGNCCWQQVCPAAMAALTHLLSGLYTPVKQCVQHYRYSTQQSGSSQILLFSSVFYTGVSVKALFSPAGDVQSEVKMPSAVSWAPLAHADTSCVASSRWPGERKTLLQGPTPPVLRRVSEVIWFCCWGILLSLCCLQQELRLLILDPFYIFLEKWCRLFYLSQILLGCTKALRCFSLAIVLTRNTLQGLLITESPYTSRMLCCFCNSYLLCALMFFERRSDKEAKY